MLKLMEVCKALGFVYGIIPKKGKFVSGASDNIRTWWKEKVKFDKNGLASRALSHFLLPPSLRKALAESSTVIFGHHWPLATRHLTVSITNYSLIPFHVRSETHLCMSNPRLVAPVTSFRSLLLLVKTYFFIL